MYVAPEALNRVLAAVFDLGGLAFVGVETAGKAM